jgi:hypothetical protein
VRAHLLHLKDEHHYSPSSMRTAVAAMRAYYGLHPGRDSKLFDLVRSPSAQKLAAVFRARMEAAWRASAPAAHAGVPAATWCKPWVVHCQPVGTGESVINYLARYVARTAISDGRIVAADR